ncbi:MAG TPA: hypothetical protein VFQ50_09350 [Flavobacterium sp.]|jgi:hypothetical protein|nr:hypothetical protein [Flavobacterium sp.]
MNLSDKEANEEQPAQSGMGEAMGPDSTTGSGFSEAERREHDGSSPHIPADPEDVNNADYPGNDSRH